MSSEWEILERSLRDLHAQMLTNNLNIISENSGILNFSCSCGGEMKIRAYKNEEFIYYNARCNNCGYKLEGIYRWLEERKISKELGNEKFFRGPVYIPLLKKEESQKIILTLENGELEITILDIDGNIMLEGILSPIKGATLYSFYELGRISKNVASVYFDPLGKVRYSLLCLDNALEGKILPLRNI